MGYGFHWFFMAACWGLVSWAVIALFMSAVRGRAGASEDSAQGILEQRFARGELNAMEFKKMTDTLAKAQNQLRSEARRQGSPVEFKRMWRRPHHPARGASS